MVRLQPEEYPQFGDALNYDRLGAGIEESLAYLRKLPPDRKMRYGADRFSVAHIMRTLETFAEEISAHPSAGQLNRVLGRDYWIYRAAGSDGQGTVLVTGYYEPVLQGSAVPTAEFSVPVRSRPADLVDIDLSLFDPSLGGRRIVGKYTGATVVPYPDRAEMRHIGNFNAISPPIAWLADEVDLFILQIQGSGKIRLPDGRMLHVRYNGSNGLPYRSIGRALIDQRKIGPEAMSMQAIRTYLRSHPDEARAIMDHNPRYIFFKTSIAGPFGALGRPLTPMRSIAVDRGIFPSAALAFLSTQVPAVDGQGQVQGWEAYGAFALAQDAGSAIKGPGRVDLFWGDGLRAEQAAGRLKNRGALYFLVLKAGAD